MSITNFLFIILYIYLFQNHFAYYSILSIPKECQDTFSWPFKGQRDVHGQICVIQNVSGQLQHYLFVWVDSSFYIRRAHRARPEQAPPYQNLHNILTNRQIS